MKFRFLLAELMAQRQLTQQALGEATGLSPVTIGSWYHGRATRADLGTAATLMQYFGLESLEQLIQAEPDSSGCDNLTA